MTLAAGFKFEHPMAAGVSPVLLLSDSRYSLSTGDADKVALSTSGLSIKKLASGLADVLGAP